MFVLGSYAYAVVLMVNIHLSVEKCTFSEGIGQRKEFINLHPAGWINNVFSHDIHRQAYMYFSLAINAPPLALVACASTEKLHRTRQLANKTWKSCKTWLSSQGIVPERISTFSPGLLSQSGFTQHYGLKTRTDLSNKCIHNTLFKWSNMTLKLKRGFFLRIHQIQNGNVLLCPSLHHGT